MAKERTPERDGDAAEQRRVRAEFDEAVNMTPGALEKWLDGAESRAVGWLRDGEAESVGHRSGARIVEIQRAAKGDLEADDYRHMAAVIGFVRRHLAQGGPDEDVEHSKWRYSLMNWGHDPLKEKR